MSNSNPSRGTNALREATGRSAKPTTVGAYLNAPSTLAELSRVLPKHLNAGRLMRIALTEVRNVPKLAECSVQSFAAALMKCGQLGLEPGGAQGHVYLIPFERNRKDQRTGKWLKSVECQVIPGYQGLAELARRSGKIESIMPRAVMRGDEFHVEFGLDERITHKPNFGIDRTDPDNLVAVYCVARLVGGGVQFDVMGIPEIIKVRDESQGYQAAMRAAEQYNKPPDSPWVSHFVAMALKTVVRRFSKFLPSSPELALAVALDERAEAGRDQASATIIDGEFIEVPDTDTDPGDDTGGDPDQGGGETNERETKGSQGDATKRGKDAAPARNDATPPVADAEGPLTFAFVAAKIKDAKTIDEVAEAAELGKRVDNEQYRKELADEAAAKWRKLSAADEGRQATTTKGK